MFGLLIPHILCLLGLNSTVKRVGLDGLEG